MSAPLTSKRLEAIIEALVARLAGPIEDGPDMPDPRDYEAALSWAQGLLHKRQYQKIAGRRP